MGLAEPVRNTPPLEVVRADLHLDPVARKDPDAVHAHLARVVGENFMAVVGLHAEGRVFERLDNCALEQDRLLLRAGVRQVVTSSIA